ncbi:hypothetical protein SUDANB171_02181 [Streptomyces sp. enrichment culture]|jgi:uncharacterized membrane protein HdeD (DUF308 family)|uniref:hypothetical protein n=1 Tax=Streptomyces xiamenensis TaxID=408015 RepID=UPI0037D6D6AB
MSQYRGIDRHRFEPARLVLGLALLTIGVLAYVQARDEGRLPVAVLLALVAGSLLLAGVVSIITQSVRRSRKEKDGERGERDRAAGDGLS